MRCVCRLKAGDALCLRSEGWGCVVFAVEVGCRDFVDRSTVILLKRLGRGGGVVGERWGSGGGVIVETCAPL